MEIRYFNDMETQKAYIKQINEDLKMNKEYEKKRKDNIKRCRFC